MGLGHVAAVVVIIMVKEVPVRLVMEVQILMRVTIVRLLNKFRQPIKNKTQNGKIENLILKPLSLITFK
jgi:hypothetical protein